jgi:hypothetical protein
LPIGKGLAGLSVSIFTQKELSMFAESRDASLIPLKTSSAILSLDQFVEGWSLSRFEGEAEPAPKRFEYWVGFDSPFANVPLVHVGVAGFDIDNRDTARLKVRAERITANGFMLVIETWRHTRVYGVDVSWLALGHA